MENSKLLTFVVFSLGLGLNPSYDSLLCCLYLSPSLGLDTTQYKLLTFVVFFLFPGLRLKP
jgi:hypothetical protein